MAVSSIKAVRGTRDLLPPETETWNFVEADVAVARAAGLHVSRIDGSDVVYNQENPYLPDILVCRPAFADQLLNAIREATHAI